MSIRVLFPSKLLVCCLFFTSVHPAVAVLGQKTVIEPTAPIVPLSGVRLQSFRPSQFSVAESQLQSGTSIREYADLTGRVFAVDWSGPLLPDLSSVLGAYFGVLQEDVAQARSEGRYRAPVNVNRSDVVIRSNGRMRNFFGHAYIPSMVPVGVNIQDVLQ